MFIKVRKTPDEFSQSINIERLAPFDLKTYETPRPSDLVHNFAATLKQTICNGIKDKTERSDACPADTKEQIHLGSG